jgi:hypothetical protein
MYAFRLRGYADGRGGQGVQGRSLRRSCSVGDPATSELRLRETSKTRRCPSTIEQIWGYMTISMISHRVETCVV